MDRLKVCIIADVNQIHVRRWVGYFLENNDVYLVNYMSKINFPNYFSEIMEGQKVGENNLKFHSFPMKKWNLISYLIFYQKLSSLLRKQKIDVIYVLGVGLASCLTSYIKDVPIVVFPFGSEIFIYPDKNQLSRFIANRTLRRADKIIVNSGHMAKKCVQLGGTEKKIRIIQQGIDLSVFRPDISVGYLRKKYGLAEDDFIILSARNFRPLYNIDTIIKSIPLTLNQVPNVKYLLVSGQWGEGTKEKKDYVSYLKELINELGVTNNIIIINALSRDEMPAFLNLADVVLSVPSSDSSPAFLLESMACGAAPIVSELPSVCEMFKNKLNAFVIPVKDHQRFAEATIALLKDDKIRAKFVDFNLKLVHEKANVVNNVIEIEELFREAIKK